MSDTVVYDNPEQGRYEAFLDGALAGFAEYRALPQGIELFHTVVDPAFGGRGIAGMMARFALDDIRVKGRRVVPTCEFMAAWIGKHPDYAELVAGS